MIGVVKEAHELGEVTSKSTQKTACPGVAAMATGLTFWQIPKRDLTIVDRSGFSVRVTLWGDQAKKYTAVDQPVLAVKGVKVGDFGGACG